MVARKRNIRGLSPRPTAGRKTAATFAVGAQAASIVDRLNLLSAGALDARVVEAADATDNADSDLVVMSGATYRELFERAEDTAARVAFARSRGEESVPVAIVDRLLAGEHPVRVWRDHRGMTLEQLGAKADLSIAYLSEIEAGKKPGSIKALRAIAVAMALDLDDLTGWLR